jgi:hypothetical protein
LFTFFDAELMLFAIRFMRAAQLPDDLEMLLDEQRLGVSAAYSDTVLVCFVTLTTSFADSRTSTSRLPPQLRQPVEALCRRI